MGLGVMGGKALGYDISTLADAELAALACAGKRGAFRTIMQRCNQRLFRVARGVMHDDFEAEDVVQEAYVRAFAHLDSFRGEASLLTWMTRIVLNEANGRLRKRRQTVGVEYIDTARAERGEPVSGTAIFGSEDPVAVTARAEIRKLIEHAVDELSDDFRLVFVLRDIEHCSVAETAAQLDLLPETVKTRLFRARRALRATLQGKLASTLDDAFLFLGSRCERMTTAVLARMDSMEDGAMTPIEPRNGDL